MNLVTLRIVQLNCSTILWCWDVNKYGSLMLNSYDLLQKLLRFLRCKFTFVGILQDQS
jgi:hypothetical protein